MNLQESYICLNDVEIVCEEYPELKKKDRKKKGKMQSVISRCLLTEQSRKLGCWCKERMAKKLSLKDRRTH